MTEAFDQGYDTYLRGGFKSENPYPVTSTFHDEWNHGFNQAAWVRRAA